MNVLVMTPLIAAFTGVLAASLLHRFLKPRRAAQLLTAAVLLAALATFSADLQVAFAGLAEIPLVADSIVWCRDLYAGGHGASPTSGLAAAVLLLVMVAGSVRYAYMVRSEVSVYRGVDGVEVIDVEGPVAFAVPGRPGGVVIGAGLLRDLDPDERAAVLAHENAHLRYNHHRLIRLSEICAAGIPLLRPMARQVRFMTERWADEVAADQVGSREIVANTIARVAFMPSASVAPLALGFAGRGIVGRVDALLNPKPMPFFRSASAAVVVLCVVGLGSGLQMHHLAQYLVHICAD
jgi:Zn-dependent protease with chaperone function